MMGFAGLGLLGVGSRRSTPNDEPTGDSSGGGCCGCLFLLIILAIGVAIAIALSSPGRNEPKTPSPDVKQESSKATSDPVAVPATAPPAVAAPDPTPTTTPDPTPSPSPKTPPVRDTRTWKDTSGQFSTSARLKSMASGKVHLIKEDGSEITVTMEKLSEDDQKYIKDQMR